MDKKKLLAMLVAGTMVVGSVAALVGCGGGKGNSVTVWVSETEGVKTLTEEQVKAFLNENKEYKNYKVTVQGISEGEAATTMVTDVSTGADIYCYAQDQLARLVEAKALSKLGDTSAKFVQDNNDAGSVKAATVNGTVYSYPLTSDNGYYMYYDKSVVKEESINDLAAIVQDCKDAGKKFSFEIGGSAWYTASFFFGAGCTSSWTYDDETNKWKAADDFSGEKGMIALKGTQILTASGVWVDSSKCSDFNLDSAVVISGTWDAGEAKKNVGNNLGIAKLPTYTVDGETYQLGSYSGYKLMGVKPQTNEERTKFCHQLAQYLTNESCQMKRLEKFSWGPSNKNAAASELAQNNEALKGLAAQAPYSTPQGQIHGGWWDVGKALGLTVNYDAAGNPTAKTETELQEMLNTYKAAIEKFEQMSVEAMEAFGVVGKIASLEGVTENLSEGQEEWADWGADYKMTKTENADGSIVWKTVAKITLADGDQIQVRKGQAWDEQYGAVGDDGYSTKSNYEITAENAGEYYVVLTLTKVGDATKGVVSLVTE